MSDQPPPVPGAYPPAAPQQQWPPSGPGGPGPWPQPYAPGPYTQVPLSNGMHVAALVCGIVGALMGLVPILFFLAIPLGVIALVLGLIAYSRAKAFGVKQGRAGAILGAIAIVLGIIGIAVIGDAFEDIGDDLSCLDQADTSAEIEACTESN